MKADAASRDLEKRVKNIVGFCKAVVEKLGCEIHPIADNRTKCVELVKR